MVNLTWSIYSVGRNLPNVELKAYLACDIYIIIWLDNYMKLETYMLILITLTFASRLHLFQKLL